MESVLQFLAVIVLLQSLVALLATLRFARYSMRPLPLRHHRHQPKAAVIVPCKGLEPGLEANIEAFCAQEYREYELIFVTQSENDPAYRLLDKLNKQSRRSVWLVVAGEAKNRGQKVHNLMAALDTLNAVDRRAEILVFADSDARPSRNWLAELVAPLDEKSVGATTGFRWYVPGLDVTDSPTGSRFQRRLASWLLSVWNSSALPLLGERSTFAWGGATAIRRETFDQLGVRNRWDGALSDDYVLTSVLHDAGYRIKFVPECLMPTHTSSTFAALREFTTRQMRITRVYAPRVWRMALVTQLLFNVTVWGGLLWLIWSRFQNQPNVGLGGLLLAILLLSVAGSWTRAVVASYLLKPHRARILGKRWAYAVLAPASSVIYLYNLVASVWSRRIVWRGIEYELVSSRETHIVSRDPEVLPLEESKTAPSKRRASARSTLP